VNIAVLASLYLVLGVGVVLVYRASRVFNFAHGDLMMLGGYGLVVAVGATGGGLLWSVPAAIAAVAVLGAAIYLVSLRPLAGHGVGSAVIVTVAVGILLRSVATLAWGAQPRYPATLASFSDTPLRLPGGAVLSIVDVAQIAAAALLFAAVQLLLHRTTLGVRMRAVAERPALAAYSGIDLHRLLALSWALAAASAALGGVLYSLRVNVQPELWLVGLKAFVPALIGGMDSVRGLIPGALLVAAVEVLAGQFLDPIVQSVAPFAVLLVALWLRPWGLFGSREELERV